MSVKPEVEPSMYWGLNTFGSASTREISCSTVSSLTTVMVNVTVVGVSGGMMEGSTSRAADSPSSVGSSEDAVTVIVEVPEGRTSTY